VIYFNTMDIDTPITPGITFLRDTSTKSASSGREAGLPEPIEKKVCMPVQQIIILPEVSKDTFPQVNLKKIFDERESVRAYSDKPLSLAELSILLHYTQGIRQITGKMEYRYVPSAGACQAFETYLLINRVEGIKPGIYRYLPLDHAIVLEDCTKGDPDDVAKSLRKPDMVRKSAVTFIWVACPARVLWLFGERGWRYLFLDAGHICQNLYLAGEAINCGVCAVGSFYDDDINEAIGIDEIDEFVLYMATVGKK